MKDLHIGDVVLVAENGGVFAYKSFEFFIHKEENHKAKFVRLKTKKGKTLELTGKHAIYKANCDSQPWNFNARSGLVVAEDLAVGDCLLIKDGNGLKIDPIVSLDLVDRTGIYAPMTENTVIVVDDIVVSCLSESTDGDLLRRITHDMLWYRHLFASFIPDRFLEWIYTLSSDAADVIVPPVLDFFRCLLPQFIPSH